MGDCRTDRKCVYGGPSQRALFLIVALSPSLTWHPQSVSVSVKESKASPKFVSHERAHDFCHLCCSTPWLARSVRSFCIVNAPLTLFHLALYSTAYSRIALKKQLNLHSLMIDSYGACAVKEPSFFQPPHNNVDL